MVRPSQVFGDTRTRLIEETIGRYFDAVSAAHGERLAIISRHQKVRWTYAELSERVDALAGALIAIGLSPGERVGIWAPNCWEWLVTQYASAKIGLILVNINPAYRRAEAEYALNKVGCKALIAAPRHKGTDYIEILRELAPELTHSRPGDLRAKRIPYLRSVISLGEGEYAGCLSFDRLLSDVSVDATRRVDLVAAALRCEQPINIQFTSGTTGLPKGATLSHRNVLNNGFLVGEAIRLTPDSRLCVPVPLYHCFGMVMGNLGCLTHAACVVYPSETFDPKSVLEAIAAERCSGLYGVPTMFIAAMNHAEFAQFDLRSLRTGIMAGSPCPIEVMRQVVERMHLPEITIAYGMTETSPVSFQSSPDDSLERRVTTVGRVQPHLEVKIVDPDGNIVPRGTRGELCTRGYSVMLGYWEEPQRTAEVLDEEGWIHTGDLGTLDPDGYCNIVGRIKDMVIRGGENISPREVEEFLYRHPAIRDVQVIGVPDPSYGEALCACIILKPGTRLTLEDVQAFCRGQIAHYKIPRYVRFLDVFPTTVTGKVQKFTLRQTVTAELGLSEVPTA